MGVSYQGDLSTLVMPDENLLMKVPNRWSLEEAATVPVVYATIIYTLKLVSVFYLRALFYQFQHFFSLEYHVC